MARPKRNTAAAKAAVESVKAAVAAEPVKAVEETAAAVTEEKKPAAKKPAAKKPAAPESKVVVQFGGSEVNTDELVEKAKIASEIKSIKKVDVYVKPEVNKVYYVVNGDTFGDFDLF
ncbi:MAG: DUF6465 family protein [Ruminococcus sp.]|nr:DUF6465 family protein [Ruminococcus sp.]